MFAPRRERANFACEVLAAREHIAHGLEAAPAALLRLLEGENLGKQLVQLGAAVDEPLLCAASLR